ncbi:hypothetical protein Tco_1244325 [Tanacetum coccineum]
MSGHGLLYIHALWEYSKSMVMNTMAEQNVPTQPPTRTDEQIVPRSQWLTFEADFGDNILLAAITIIHANVPGSAVHHNGDDFILDILKVSPPPTIETLRSEASKKLERESRLLKLVDEDDEAQQESIPQEEGNDPDLELAKKMSLEAHQEKGEGEGDDADLERAIKLAGSPAFLPQGRNVLAV